MKKVAKFLVIVMSLIAISGCVKTTDWQKKDDDWWDAKIAAENKLANEMLIQGRYKEVANKQWIKLSNENKRKTLSLINKNYKPKDLADRLLSYKSKLNTNKFNIDLYTNIRNDLVLAKEYVNSWIVQISITLNLDETTKPLVRKLKDNSQSLMKSTLNVVINYYKNDKDAFNKLVEILPVNLYSNFATAKRKANIGELGELEILATTGNPYAQNELGRIYHYGEVVDRDDKKAIKWLKLAAEQDHPGAQFAYSVMHMGGYGIKQSWSKAFHWSLQSAKQGYREAQYSVANQYCIGLGVEANFDKAYSWWSKSEKNGDSRATDKLKNIQKECGKYSQPSSRLAKKLNSIGDVEKSNNTTATYSNKSIKNKNKKNSKDSESGFLSDTWDNLNTQVGQNSWDTKLFRLGEALSNMGTPYSQRGVNPAYRWMADDPNSGFTYDDYNRMTEQNKLDRKIKELEKKIEDSTFGYTSGTRVYSKSNKYMGYIKNGGLYNKYNQKTGYIRGNSIYSNSGEYLGYKR